MSWHDFTTVHPIANWVITLLFALLMWRVLRFLKRALQHEPHEDALQEHQRRVDSQGVVLGGTMVGLIIIVLGWAFFWPTLSSAASSGSAHALLALHNLLGP